MALFAKNTAAILEHLIINPLQKYNVNQIARELDISVGSAHKIVKELDERHILSSEQMGNAIFYRLDFSSTEARRIAEIILTERASRILKDKPVAKVYAEALRKCGSTQAIILFGSILTKGRGAKDVDALFLIKDESDVRSITDFCLGLKKTKTISPLLMTGEDMKQQLKDKSAVLIDILKKGIVISGEGCIVEVLSSVTD